MASAMKDDDDSFCFDPLRIEYSEPTTCVVQGKGANQIISKNFGLIIKGPLSL